MQFLFPDSRNPNTGFRLYGEKGILQRSPLLFPAIFPSNRK
ncbi:hypothetical protein NEIFLAOT_01467 [Neisseria flavescens NRL30031/H210]|uniref:Uncharacterized protein n=1 Tax=Neisseria flavescens NRL30031/H210 TaxID=546264 RepID=C0END3_NEIFL|nr:hypothetical protein NEIFLAOT_01467 [Neisseria flavescens NRL30031/H210]